MNGLVRFRTRDGRYLSGGYAGTPGGGLHAVAGPPSSTETRCVRQGTYTLSYPGADDVTVSVGDEGVSGVHLVVPTSSVTGYVSNAASGDRLAEATVHVLGTRLPVAVSQGLPDLGRYLISGVRSGDQQRLAKKPGFSPNGLAAFGASTRISGGWGCDSFGFIRLNNRTPVGTGITTLAGVTEANFNTMRFFTIVGPFHVGLNQLEVVVTDAGNPGGLNVSRLVLTP
jgi:hypothetical protein